MHERTSSGWAVLRKCRVTPTAMAALPPKLGSRHHPLDGSCRATTPCAGQGWPCGLSYCVRPLDANKGDFLLLLVRGEGRRRVSAWPGGTPNISVPLWGESLSRRAGTQRSWCFSAKVRFSYTWRQCIPKLDILEHSSRCHWPVWNFKPPYTQKLGCILLKTIAKDS